MGKRLITAAAMAAVAAALWVPAAQAAGAPVIAGAWAANVSASAADLLGQVNPNGFATSARVEYLPAAAYEANLNAVPPRDPFSGASRSPQSGVALGAGEAGVTFSRHLGFLSASTPYRYRVVATNAEGTLNGPPRLLTTTETAPTFSLPDDRGWELVSPADKNGGEVAGPGELFGGGAIQAAALGGAIAYGSSASFAGGAGSPGASQYIARRTGSGWATENVTLPTLAGAYGDSPDGVPFQLFSGDLGRALIATPQRCEEDPCPRSYTLRPSSGALAASPLSPDMRLAGASPDLSASVLSSCKALTANATEIPGVGDCDPSFPNLYRWTGASLTAINLLPGAPTTTPGAELAAPAGAVSPDGSRVYFTVAGALYLREGNETVLIDAAASFETASANGALAFFTKAGHLYRYEAATKASADLTPGGEVEGVLGASPDGAYLYYLTPAGLYLHRNGAATKAAAGAEAANYPPATGTARVAANGNLAFLAAAPLTDFDNNAHPQAYLYSPATATLTCASCNPSGARATGPAVVPGARANGTAPTATRAYKPRALSASGERLFFESPDPLVASDTNAARDVYQWQAQGAGSCQKPGGCIALISDGRAPGGARFIDASADGSEAYFLTAASLVAADPGLNDLYVARVGGGFADPDRPIACLGDACQPVPSAPDDPLPGTLLPRAEGNPPLSIKKAKAKKKASKKKQAQAKKKKRQAQKKKQAARKHQQGKKSGARR
jgi:hypothetical protein